MIKFITSIYLSRLLHCYFFDHLEKLLGVESIAVVHPFYDLGLVFDCPGVVKIVHSGLDLQPELTEQTISGEF